MGISPKQPQIPKLLVSAQNWPRERSEEVPLSFKDCRLSTHLSCSGVDLDASDDRKVGLLRVNDLGEQVVQVLRNHLQMYPDCLVTTPDYRK